MDGAYLKEQVILLCVDLGTILVDPSTFILIRIKLYIQLSFRQAEYSVRRLDIEDDRRLVCFGSRIRRLILTPAFLEFL